MEESIAHTVSSMLARDQEIIQGVLDNDRSAVIDKTQDVWDVVDYSTNHWKDTKLFLFCK